MAPQAKRLSWTSPSRVCGRSPPPAVADALKAERTPPLEPALWESGAIWSENFARGTFDCLGRRCQPTCGALAASHSAAGEETFSRLGNHGEGESRPHNSMRLPQICSILKYEGEKLYERSQRVEQHYSARNERTQRPRSPHQ